MGVTIERQQPSKKQPPKTVTMYGASFGAGRSMKVVAHNHHPFGSVAAPSVSLHTNMVNGAAGFGAGICLTMKEAKAFHKALGELIDGLQ